MVYIPGNLPTRLPISPDIYPIRYFRPSCWLEIPALPLAASPLPIGGLGAVCISCVLGSMPGRRHCQQPCPVN